MLGALAVIEQDRSQAIRERFVRAFPQTQGRVLRGTLTRLYDERFGKFELAKDVYVGCVGSPIQVQGTELRAVVELRRSQMIHRIDLIADALFLHGNFNVDLDVSQRKTGAKEWVDVSMVRIRLENLAKGLRGLLVLRPMNNESLPYNFEFLLIKRLASDSAFRMDPNGPNNSELHLVETDLFLRNGSSLIESTKGADTGLETVLSLASYKTVQEAFTGLCEKLGINGATLIG